MNLATIPLLIAALLMLSAGGTPPDDVHLLLSGGTTLGGPVVGASSEPEAVIVADARAHLPGDAALSGPVYVIGGELTVDGRVTGDVVQLAGSVIVGPEAVIDGELRLIAGTLDVDPGADVARRSSVDLGSEGRDGPGSLLPTVGLAVLLALVGAVLARFRPRALGNVADAVTSHPVIVVTVGLLLAVTAVALLVYLAFTLVLLPVAILGLVAGVVALAVGTVGIGHAVGRRIPGLAPPAATGVGVVVTVLGLSLVGVVPLVGALVSGAVVLAGLGATILTYFGLAPFEPVRLVD